MEMMAASAILAAVAGGGIDGYIDTKYALNPDGTPKTVMGMAPGIALGVGTLVAGVVLAAAGARTAGAVFVAGSVGVLAVEGARYIATQTAAKQAAQGTQGLPGYAYPAALPQQSAPVAAANAFRSQGVTSWELDSVFGSLDQVRRRAPMQQAA